jgi:hypothetical protein
MREPVVSPAFIPSCLALYLGSFHCITLLLKSHCTPTNRRDSEQHTIISTMLVLSSSLADQLLACLSEAKFLCSPGMTSTINSNSGMTGRATPTLFLHLCWASILA